MENDLFGMDVEKIRAEIDSIIKEELTPTSSSRLIKLFDTYLGLLSASLTYENSFFAGFLVRTSKVVSLRAPFPAGARMTSRGPEITFNPLLLLDWSTIEIKAIIIHELYHLVFMHLLRAKETDLTSKIMHELENIAMDAAINQYIQNLPNGTVTLEYISSNFNIPLNTLTPKMNYEFYLEALIKNGADKKMKKEMEDELKKLLEELKKDLDDVNNGKMNPKDFMKKYNGTGKLNPGNAHEQWDLSEIVNKEQLSDELKNLLNNVLSSCNNRGDVPSEIQAAIDALNRPPKIPWQKALRQVIGSIKMPFKKSIMKRSRRLPTRLDIKGKMSKNVIRIACAIDTSGSVSDEEISYIFNEIFNILGTQEYHMSIIECDAEIQQIQEVTKKKEIDITARGRGGTCFEPVFKWEYEKKKTERDDVLIYFTDGYGEATINEMYRPKTDTKLIWVITRSSKDSQPEDILSCYKQGWSKKIYSLNL